MDSEFAMRFKQMRDNLGLSQRALGESLGGVPATTISKYEQGLNKPSAEALAKLGYLGVNLNWLLTGNGFMLNVCDPIDPQYGLSSEKKVAIGERLKKLRKELGIDINEMANVFDVTTSDYLKYESGEDEPKKKAFMNLLKKYQISYDWLMYGYGEIFEPIEDEKSEGKHKSVDIELAKALLGEDFIEALSVLFKTNTKLADDQIFEVLQTMSSLSENERKNVVMYARELKADDEVKSIKRELYQLREEIKSIKKTSQR